MKLKEAYRYFLIISQSPFLQVNQFPMFYLEFANVYNLLIRNRHQDCLGTDYLIFILYFTC